MENTLFQTLDINQLAANYGTVSQDKFGFFLCKQGCADILLNDNKYHIEKGVFCIYAPRTFIRIVQYSADLDGYLLETTPDVIFPSLSTIPVMERLFIRSHPCISLNQEQYQRSLQMVEMLQSRAELMCKSTKPKSTQLLRQLVHSLLHALVYEMMGIYFDGSPVEERPQNRQEKNFNRFFISLYHHCAKERSVLYYANEQHLSPNYFSSIVKSISGHTAIQWIETFTMILAQHYLGSTKLSIKEIANRLHFPDQSIFGRYFKKHYGISPTEYRKQRT